MRHESATLADLEVHWTAWGSPGDPLAVLVHGFPDTPHTWRHLGPRLAGEGFHVVAPWLRGYAPTGLAPDDSYQVGALATDARRLADHLGAGQAVFVGHDWGAITGYAAASGDPSFWTRLVTMAVPPLGSLLTGFLQYPQIRRSWYMFVFQHPLALDAVLADDLAFIEGLWSEWSPGYDGSEDIAHVRVALGMRDRMAAALGYYQAMLGDAHKHDGYAEADAAAFLVPSVPTLYLHGVDDGCMGAELVADAAAGLTHPGSRAEVLDGVGHFLHLEDPDGVNDRIITFLTS